MRRREALQVLGTAATLPVALALAPRDALAASRAIHDRLTAAGYVPLAGLTAARKETLAIVADVIIPATDTPGAREARVHDFIDVVYADWMTDAERASFDTALDTFDARSRRDVGVPFLEAPPARRETLVAAIDAEAFAVAPNGTPRPPYRRLKELVLHGYYTSKVGQERELRARIVPGTYDGCRPIAPATGGDA